MPVTTGNDDDDTGSLPPDEQVYKSTFSEIERSSGKLSIFAASQKVMRANPELAERYRYMPGVKDR